MKCPAIGDAVEIEMINNNLDFEKNSNNTAPTLTTTTTATTKNSNSGAHAMPTSAAASAASTVAAAATNYFNRFDNRIAANLAAVLNGSRFRSSSSTSSSSSGGHTKTANRSNANHANANANDATTLRKGRDETALHLQLNNAAKAVVVSGGAGGAGDVDGNDCGSASGSENGSMGRRRPVQLFSQANLNCNDNEKIPRIQTSSQTTPPSSDEDNSPTELNNCKRLADKPPLVKRLTMGLLRGHEESRPLVHNSQTTASNSISISSSTTSSSSSHSNSSTAVPSAAGVGCGYLKTSNTSLMVGIGSGGGGGGDGGVGDVGSNQIYSNGYINEEAFEPEKYIASKFGDSCRQSLTAIPMLDTLNLNDNSEFNLKKRYLRETSSANSSPKIFANRLRMNATSSRYSTAGHGTTTNGTYGSHGNTTNPLLLMMSGGNDHDHGDDDDADEAELKDASWFQAGISRDIAVEVLASKSPGAFLVRKSSSKPGCYALTLRVPSPPGPKIANYIILRTARGYKIKGFRKEFTTLKALITHHSVMPELLPVPLAMPRPTNMTSSRRNLDDFDTYDSLQMLLKYLRAKNMENE